MSFLQHVNPMGIYETLYAFKAASGSYMGDPGTHPWSQGFPLTTQLPGGPSLPDAISVSALDRRYPKAWGHPDLREAIAQYYRTFYGASITADNVTVFAGGRPAIVTVLLFLKPGIEILIEEVEYTPYWDMLKLLNRSRTLIPSNTGNGFSPHLSAFEKSAAGRKSMLIRSNPCNPTGVARTGSRLEELVRFASQPDRGALIDEAYEFFLAPEPESALRYIPDINVTNIFVVGAATKGLQAPGIRIGWAVSSEENAIILGNFSSFGMGGVSHLSQQYAIKLLQLDRVRQARAAVSSFYKAQRDRYRAAFDQLALELWTGEGGFYHWAKLPGELSADQFNRRLFTRHAAILPGTLCDMERRGVESPLRQFFRFSFGPLEPQSFDGDIEILRQALAE